MPARKLTYTTRLKCSFGAVRSLVTGEVATLKARIESLQAELAKLEATAASHRADFERERDRADRLLTEWLKANANTTAAMATKLEGEIAAMRLAAKAGTGTVSDGSAQQRPSDGNASKTACRAEPGAIVAPLVLSASRSSTETKR